MTNVSQGGAGAGCAEEAGRVWAYASGDGLGGKLSRRVCVCVLTVRGVAGLARSRGIGASQQSEPAGASQRRQGSGAGQRSKPVEPADRASRPSEATE